MLISQNFGH